MRAFLHNLLRNPDSPMSIGEIDSFTIGDAQANWYLQFTDKKPTDLTLEDLASYEVLQRRPLHMVRR